MNTNVTSIRTANGDQPPHGTKLAVRMGSRPGFVKVLRQYPGESTMKDLGDLPVQKDGSVVLP